MHASITKELKLSPNFFVEALKNCLSSFILFNQGNAFLIDAYISDKFIIYYKMKKCERKKRREISII